MNAILAGIIFAVVLSAGILVLLEIGRRVGVHRIAEEGETASQGLSAIEGAIFALLGLILAFLFSGALTRFDAARHLVVGEANDIGTAWLRIALLPTDAQPSMRDLFRRYLNVLYSIAFAVVLSVTAYVIIDLEYPRLGLLQVSDSDKVLVDLRRSMN
jgi:hypothetical protein